MTWIKQSTVRSAPVLLALSACLLINVIQAQTAGIAQQFLESLEEARFDQAHAMLSSEVSDQISRAQLEQIWLSLPGQVGAYQGHEAPQISSSETGDLFVFRLNFANAALDARINVNQNGQVDGFFLVPAAPGAPAEKALASSDRWVESEFVVADELPGILTLPEGTGPFPAVVLVHGSGPGDRDQTIGPNTPFRDLAHGLAEQGIASLRYDKRSLVKPADLTGAYTVEQEVLSDVRAAVEQVQEVNEINPQRVVVAGLSLGGLLAPRIGLANPELAGLILMAAPARGLEAMVPQQLRYIFSLDGQIDQAEAAQLAQIDAQAAAVAELSDPQSAAPGLLGVPESYLLDLRNYDPIATARSLDLPMLILQGGRDYQVTVEDDFAMWQRAFAEVGRVTLKRYDRLNHVFISGKGMATPAEYINDVGHVDPEVISDMAKWIHASFN